MSRIGRMSPGECPICGAAHTTCTAGGPQSITVVQTPQRDAAVAVVVPPLEAERVQATLPPGSFTTGTYRGKPKR